jgi:hypothetical protein
MPAPLPELVWTRIDATLQAKGQSPKDLRRLLKGRRNKNTLTKWFKEPPDLRLSDLTDVAEALSIEPARLLAGLDGGPSPKAEVQQLVLPFTSDDAVVTLEIRVSQDALLLRRPPGRADRPA